MEKGITLLQATNLSIGYKVKKQSATIASNINLELKTGSLTALIGANGIGKSTLLRTLTGIQQRLSGSVLLNNKAIAEYSAQELSQNLSIVLTASDAVRFTSKIKEDATPLQLAVRKKWMEGK